MRLALAALALLVACGGDDDDDGPPDADPGCPVTGAPALTFTNIPLSNGEIAITGMATVPETDELLVLEKSGRISHYRMSGDTAELLGEFTVPNVRDFADCGLLHAVVDPPYLFVTHCVSDDGGRPNHVTRLDFTPADYSAIPASAVLILEITDPDIGGGSQSHNVGGMEIDEDGHMWLGTGDRGVSERVQDTGSHLGKILRIIPSREPGVGGYQPAPGNPFAADANPDVYALGFRHPWSGHIDTLGRFWAADVGTDVAEEINLVAGPGQNFGWPDHEGPCESDCEDLVNPLFTWNRSSGHRYTSEDPDAVPTANRVAWVGPEYRSNADDPYGGALDGVVLFGEFCVGYVRAARVNDEGRVCTDQHVGHQPNLSAIRQGAGGYWYGVTFGACTSGDPDPGKLWRIELAASE